MKKFNTSGPCNSIEHYMIDAATRLQGVEELIDDKQYFVIHAARQSGKTTYLKDLAARLNAGEKYIEDGLEQTAGYMDLHCCNEGWMVVFDRRSTVAWEDKLYIKKETVNGKTITIVGV